MRHRPAFLDPADVDGLVATVVGIDQRLALFRRRLSGFAGEPASRPDGAGPGPDAAAHHIQHGDRAMPP